MEVPLTPLALVARGLDAYPGRAAIREDGVVRTYAEFGERVSLAAGALDGLGIGPADRVALLAPNTAEALEAYTAIPALGSVLVPVNTRLSVEEIAYILDHSHARCLLVDADFYEPVATVLAGRPELTCVVYPPKERTGPLRSRFEDWVRKGHVLDYEALLGEGRPISLDPERVDEHAPITLNYTSGTTGRPKGVLLTHRGTCINALHMILALGLNREDVHLHVAPMFHANGWGSVPSGRPRWAPWHWAAPLPRCSLVWQGGIADGGGDQRLHGA